MKTKKNQNFMKFLYKIRYCFLKFESYWSTTTLYHTEFLKVLILYHLTPDINPVLEMKVLQLRTTGVRELVTKESERRRRKQRR
jgi:hypothetical protein